MMDNYYNTFKFSPNDLYFTSDTHFSLLSFLGRKWEQKTENNHYLYNEIKHDRSIRILERASGW